MLGSMRKMSKGIVSKLLMGLLVLSFAVWGVGDIITNSGATYAAKVGSETVSLYEFQQTGNELKRQLMAQGMTNIPPGALEQTTIRQLVQSKLNLVAMSDIGLFVNEKLIGKQIAAMPQFHDDSGKFDAKQFVLALQAKNLPEKIFVNEMRKDIAAQFLADSVNMQDATAPESVLKLDAITRRETRDVVLFTIPARDAASNEDESSLKAYYDQNKATDYMKPETRTIDYVVLSKDDIDAVIDAAITEDMVSKAAAAKPDMDAKFIRLKLRSEQRDAVMQNLNNTIEDELAAGKPLSEALSKAGLRATPKTLSGITAEAGKTSNDEITKTVAEQGFTLNDGEVSGLISTQSGTSLMVSLKAITPATPKPYEEVKADVKQRLGRQLAREAARTKAVSVKEALAKAPNWQAVASEQKVDGRAISAIPRPEVAKAASVPPSLQQAIFERNVGEVAGPLTLPNGDQLLALVTESHLPQVNLEKATPKASEAVTAKLASDIENRAYLSFTQKHKVVVNPAILRSNAVDE